MRNLGTPVFGRRYFECLKSVFAESSEVVTVTLDGQPLAGVLSFFFRDEVLPYYGGGCAAAREHAANDFMYWEVMRRACEAGIRIYDFGRSKVGTGAFAFKKHWGFEPEPLHYEHALLPAGGDPGNQSPQSEVRPDGRHLEAPAAAACQHPGTAGLAGAGLERRSSTGR